MTSFDELVGSARIVVCCGSGGVGKTTTAAVLGIHAARLGRRAVVVTIDPARRLADALGLGDTGLGNDPRRVELPVAGELWAMMLDPAATFDGVVARYSLSGDQAQRITENRFYRNLVGALSGTQEYMAAEKLYELHLDDRFDVVIIDTPPTRNALDFLDAPGRLTRFLDHRVYRALMLPSRLGMKVVNVATQTVLRPLNKVVGADVITDVIGFFQAFDGMEAGFRERATQVIGLLHDASTRYVLIASPRADTVAEARFFAERLAGDGLPVAGVIVNRIHPDFGSGGSPTAPDDALARNLHELRQVAARERRAVGPLVESLDLDVAVAYVPLRPVDLSDMEGLAAVENAIFPGGAGIVTSRARADRH